MIRLKEEFDDDILYITIKTDCSGVKANNESLMQDIIPEKPNKDDKSYLFYIAEYNDFI